MLPALGHAPLSGISWLGFAAGQGEWYATGGLVLSVLALGFGLLIYLLPSRGRTLATASGPSTVFTGGEPLSPKGHLHASDFSHVVMSSLTPVYRILDVDRIWLGLWHATGRVASALTRPLSSLETSPRNLSGGCGKLGRTLRIGALAPQLGGPAGG